MFGDLSQEGASEAFDLVLNGTVQQEVHLLTNEIEVIFPFNAILWLEALWPA